GGAIGRAIDKGMQGGLAAGIDHGKAGRGLTDVPAYDPSTEANYLSAMSALRSVNFPLLAQLKSRKDASIADIMVVVAMTGTPKVLASPTKFSADRDSMRGSKASE
nr:hypothetical protein [Tanacetum cinerariifolium]